MIKVQFMSDLHLEFLKYKWDIPNTDADLIVLAGDIGVGASVGAWVVGQAYEQEKPIIWIMGNHEYYGGDLSRIDNYKMACSACSNIYVLDNESIELFGVKFICSTLWTDYCLYGRANRPTAMDCAQQFMMDHKVIKTREGLLFTPNHALDLHERALDYVTTELNNDTKPKIVVTHHAPSAWAIGPQYRGDMGSPAFASDLEGLIIQTKPPVWVSGHTHWSYRKVIGDTLCVANCKGYPREGLLGFDSSLVLEI